MKRERLHKEKKRWTIETDPLEILTLLLSGSEKLK